MNISITPEKFRKLRNRIQKYVNIVCEIANVKPVLIEIPDYYNFLIITDGCSKCGATYRRELTLYSSHKSEKPYEFKRIILINPKFTSKYGTRGKLSLFRIVNHELIHHIFEELTGTDYLKETLIKSPIKEVDLYTLADIYNTLHQHLFEKWTRKISEYLKPLWIKHVLGRKNIKTDFSASLIRLKYELIITSLSIKICKYFELHK